MTDRPTLPIAPEHLPAVVAALRADDVAYLNVGHTMVHPGSPRYVSGALPEFDEPVPAPHLDWRELADATCELSSCDDGWIDTMRGDRTEHCEDCRGTGKPIHTLTVECPKCHGEGQVLWPSYNSQSRSYDGPDKWGDCPVCLDDGSVSVDVVVAELVPVVQYSADLDGVPPYPPHITLPGDSADHFIAPHRWNYNITPLGPPLQPGDWVARLEMSDD